MPVIDLNNIAAIYRGGQQMARLFRGASEIWTETAIANLGVGTNTPMVLAGNSEAAAVGGIWWGGADGLQGGETAHTILSSTRGDYSGPISSAAQSAILPGIGAAWEIGIQNSSRFLQERWQGEWAEYCDPVNDMALFTGGAFVLWEGEEPIGEDWQMADTGKMAQPYYWAGDCHKRTLARDLSFEYGHFARAVAAGVAPYLVGAWPPMIEEGGGNANIPARDAEWRTRFDGYDMAHRYRRDWLRAELAANGLSDDLWIVPAHLAVARWYDDDLAGNLPAGLTSHRDMHADDNTSPGHLDDNGGKHPWMLSREGAYCIRTMIYEVVEGQDALALPDNATEGITGAVAAYLRQVAKDVLSDYAPAGRGGSAHAETTILTATAAPPQDALENCAAHYLDGGSPTAIPTTEGVRYLAAIVNFDNAGDQVTDSETELVHLFGSDDDHMVLKMARPSWHDGGATPVVWGQVWDAAGVDQGFAMFNAPTSGDWLVEIWVDDAMRFRLVDLAVSDPQAAKVQFQRYGGGSNPALSACSSFTIPAQAAYAIHAAWASENIPTDQEYTDLNAWIDGLDPTWFAWAQ